MYIKNPPTITPTIANPIGENSTPRTLLNAADTAGANVPVTHDAIPPANETAFGNNFVEITSAIFGATSVVIFPGIPFKRPIASKTYVPIAVPNVDFEKAPAIFFNAMINKEDDPSTSLGIKPNAESIGLTILSTAVASLIAPKAIINFPSIVVPNPEISPPNIVLIVVNTSPNIPLQSILLRNVPMPLPSPAQSVFCATCENTPRRFFTKVLNICPFSSQLTPVIKVLIP